MKKGDILISFGRYYSPAGIGIGMQWAWHGNENETWGILTHNTVNMYHVIVINSFHPLNSTFISPKKLFRKRMKMNIIAAVDKKFGIGKNNTLPWHLPKEYAHFVRLTTITEDPSKINAVIMGRKCWESIPEKFRPLKNRLNIILSRTMEPKVAEHLIVANDLDQALGILSGNEMFKNRIETLWNVGGHDIYALGLRHPQLHKLVLTRIDEEFHCDVSFPQVDWEQFESDTEFNGVDRIEEKGIVWYITSYIRKPVSSTA